MVQIDALLAVSSLLCEPASPLFLWKSSSPCVSATIIDHGLTAVTAANPGISPGRIIVEHLLGGLCAGKPGPACISVMANCRVCTVCPSVFHAAVRNVPLDGPATRFPAHNRDLSASCGLDATTSGDIWTYVLLSRLRSLKRLLSFKGERDYALRFVREMYEVLSEHLRDVSRAHGLGGIESRTAVEKPVPPCIAI